jgi:ATP-dependent helicase/nuclease subunit B
VVSFKEGDTVADAAQRHLSELQSMMSGLRARKSGYIPRRRPQKSTDVGEYDHLARVSEWLAAGADEEEPSQRGP